MSASCSPSPTRERARLARQIIIGLLYPAFLFHFAFLIMPVGQLVDLVKTGDIAAFVVRKLPCSSSHLPRPPRHPVGRAGNPRTRLAFAPRNAFGLVPLFGKARRSLALARLSLALDALLNAGVAATRAWPLAGAASGSPALEREMSRWIPLLADGTPAGDLVQRSSRFPPHFSTSTPPPKCPAAVDDALPRLTGTTRTKDLRLTKIAAGVLTGLVYFGILLVVAWQIVSFWLGYYGQILDEME
jgi:hypothetical protein